MDMVNIQLYIHNIFNNMGRFEDTNANKDQGRNNK